MTIFTIDFLNNNYLDNPLLKEIMKSWKKLGCQIKIYNYNSPEIIEINKLYNNYISEALLKNKISYATDVAKLYILSKNNDYLFLDSDVFVLNNNLLNYCKKENYFFDSFFGSITFGTIYNKNCPKIFEYLLKKYYDHTNLLKMDREILKEEPQMKNIDRKFLGIYHYNTIDDLYNISEINKKRLLYIDTDRIDINQFLFTKKMKHEFVIPYLYNKKAIFIKRLKNKILQPWFKDLTPIIKYQSESWEILKPYFEQIKLNPERIKNVGI